MPSPNNFYSTPKSEAEGLRRFGVIGHFSELVSNLPQWIESGSKQLQDLEKWAFAQKLPLNLREVAIEELQKFSEALKSLSSQIINFI